MTNYGTDVRKESWNCVWHDQLWHRCEEGSQPDSLCLECASQLYCGTHYETHDVDRMQGAYLLVLRVTEAMHLFGSLVIMKDVSCM